MTANNINIRTKSERSNFRKANGDRFRGAESKRARLTAERRQARTLKTSARAAFGGAL